MHEAVADGASSIVARETAKRMLAILKRHVALDDLARTPLAVRLLYPKLDRLDVEKNSPTLGDLLIELLVERLGAWDERDQKKRDFDSFQDAFPTPESKAGLLGALALTCGASNQTVGTDHARRLLCDRCSASGSLASIVAQEALAFFEHAGLIEVEPSVGFVFQPLKQVASAFTLVDTWMDADRSAPPLETLEWRTVSFAATIARRRGQTETVSLKLRECINTLLETQHGIAPASHVVAESRDVALAELAVDGFAAIGRRPLTWTSEDKNEAARAIAETIELAGDLGFNWLYESYLDPRYPLVNRGSAVICSVFRHWAALVRESLTVTQKQRLARMVQPYLTHAHAMVSFLDELVMLVPDSFELNQRLWLYGGMLGDRLFGDHAGSQMRAAFGGGHQELVNAVLCRRADKSFHAVSLYLDLNANRPPVEVLKCLVESVARNPETHAAATTNSHGSKLLGPESWRAFLRWCMTEPHRDDRTATGASLLLHECGESRLAVIGQALLYGLHDGGYVSDAEEVLSQLIERHGDGAVWWLAERIQDNDDRLFGAHSGLWRLLLRWIHLVGDDGPELLGDCMHAVGPFLLARYPEVRLGLRRLLKDPRYRTALHTRLWNVVPETRFGSAMVLATSEPMSEGEAVYVAIRSRPSTKLHSYHEWEFFFQSLSFSHSVLEYIYSKLGTLNLFSRALALAVLSKHGFSLNPREQAEVVERSLEFGNWPLDFGEFSSSEVNSHNRFDLLVQHLERFGSDESRKAAELLLMKYPEKLSRPQEAQCWLALTSGRSVSPDALLDQLLRIVRNETYRSLVETMSVQFYERLGEIPLIGMVAAAARDVAKWKDVIWALLCDDTRFRIDDEDRGEVLLEFGRQAPDHSRCIGEAAKELLDDPRLQKDRWTDAYHWVAVIADEFGGLPPEQLEGVLLAGSPIHGSATRALIARLGRTPENLPLRDHPSRIPREIERVLPPPSQGDVIASLMDCARTSERLHPATCRSIESAILNGTLPDDTLRAIDTAGAAGALISEALRFCFGRPSSFQSRVRLLRHPFLTREQSQDPCLGRLLALERIAHSAAILEGKQRRDEYVYELDAEFGREGSWSVAIATELLSVRGELSPNQCARVFRDYAERHGLLHERLAIGLVPWLASLAPDESSGTITQAISEAIQILDETGWDSGSTGLRHSAYPYLIFPLVIWAYTGTSTEECERVFLRGLKFVFQEAPRGQIGDAVKPIAVIEPLLAKVSNGILSAVMEKGRHFPDPAVRAITQLTLAVRSGIAREVV